MLDVRALIISSDTNLQKFSSGVWWETASLVISSSEKLMLRDKILFSDSYTCYSAWSVFLNGLVLLAWCSVKFRVDFKILLFVFKALHGYAPQYICNLLIPHSTSRSLRSSSQFLLSVPRSHFKTKGDRAFAVAAPRLWNSLPLHIRSSPSISLFKSALKTHFYSVCFNSVWECKILFFPLFVLIGYVFTLFYICCTALWLQLLLFLNVLYK